jgi:soluble lytic murein transglycosylase-like protein
MHRPDRRTFVLTLAVMLAACGHQKPVTRPPTGNTPEMQRLVDKYATLYDVPAPLIHRVIQRESDYRSNARHGPYYGLMQILPQTARTMGHSGPDYELYDPDVNLRYGVKYLRGAWLVSDGSYDKAIYWYSRGYYYEAKRRGLLDKTGLRST